MPDPTSLVSSSITITLQDIASGIQVFNRITPPALFDAVNVQYQGFVNIPINSSITFAPINPITIFAVVYARNIGPTSIELQYVAAGGNAQTNVMILDSGCMFLYATPQLGSVSIATVLGGITSFGLATGATTTTNVEVLAAG